MAHSLRDVTNAIAFIERMRRICDHTLLCPHHQAGEQAAAFTLLEYLEAMDEKARESLKRAMSEQDSIRESR